MITRRLNTFEKILLFIGVLIIILGFGLIQSMFLTANEGISWAFLQTMFLWLLLVMAVILLAVLENLREEMKEVIVNQGKELRYLSKGLKTKKKRR